MAISRTIIINIRKTHPDPEDYYYSDEYDDYYNDYYNENVQLAAPNLYRSGPIQPYFVQPNLPFALDSYNNQMWSNWYLNFGFLFQPNNLGGPFNIYNNNNYNNGNYRQWIG